MYLLTKMKVYRLKDVIKPEEREELLSLAKSSTWLGHYIDDKGFARLDGPEGTDYNMIRLDPYHKTPNFIAARYGIKPMGMSLIKSPPNSQLDWHNDPDVRMVNITVPLAGGSRDIWYETDEGIEVISYDYPVVIDSRTKHRAEYNGEEDSYVLQLSSAGPWDKVIEKLKDRELIV